MERGLLGSPNALEKLKEDFTSALQGIREEFDDHLESINDNTNEIQANYEYLCRLDAKIDRLSDQIASMKSLLSRFTGMPAENESRKEISLTEKEKEVFLILYTASNERPITYSDISKPLRESDFLVRSYITNLIEKGVPIRKQYLQGKTYLFLDNAFREQQAKTNLLRINQMTL
ncbi:hypothetical protein JXB11_04450 [Candidatus Woesearchaeota archaeon]|nr:hypothetical protein [Candidatus Woesearchaeota archaeon]